MKKPLPTFLRGAFVAAVAALGSGNASADDYCDVSRDRADRCQRVHIGTTSYDPTPWLTAFRGGGGGVALDRSWTREWETFTIVDLDGGTLDYGDFVGIQSVNGKFLSVQVAQGGAVYANRDRLGEWETFRLLRDDTATGPDGESINNGLPIGGGPFQIVAYSGMALTTFDGRRVYALGPVGERGGPSYFTYRSAD